MTQAREMIAAVDTGAALDSEARRALRRLAEPGAILAVARDMEMAVIVRDGPGGTTARSAVVPREVAQTLALRDWIACLDPLARIVRYHVTAAGRAALKRELAEAENHARAAIDQDDAPVPSGRREPADDTAVREFRLSLAESPLTGLSRRRDKDGQPFLSRDQIIAGERLREDYELSRLDPAVAQDWDAFLQGGAIALSAPTNAGGAAAARARIEVALSELGPGLGDVALRCCCYLEGLEVTEQRMGWAARSGKIVLRIALDRLRRHYDRIGKGFGPMIG